MFDTVHFKVIQKIDSNDEFQASITVEDRDDYEIWELESVPVELPATMRTNEEHQENVNNRSDWSNTLMPCIMPIETTNGGTNPFR